MRRARPNHPHARAGAPPAPRRIVQAALVCLLGLTTVAAQPEDDALRLIVLDVREGQAILLQRGSHGLLIDSGRPGMGRHVLDRLDHHGVEQLDTVVYTHPHPDHIGSRFRIREAFPRVQVIDDGHRREGTNWPDTARWAATSLDRLPDERHRIVGSGDQWRWRDVSIEVLWPDDTRGGSLNGRSLVLVLRYGDGTVLHMGDVGTPVERQLLERDAVPEAVDVLIAGHYGSKDTSSAPLLERADPRFAIVSTDANNIRGYPDAHTIARLDRAAETLLRTWIDGEICLRLGEKPSSARQCSNG